jgi:hypothetical protein
MAVRARAGERDCGDRHVVCPSKDGVLLAVVDGLGHGPDAAAAAGLAVEVLEEHRGEALSTLVERCHEALVNTRGVVMSLARVDRTSTLTWLGVGNVEAVLVRPGERGASREQQLLLRAGVVGFQLPSFRPAHVPLRRGDLLGLASDGVRSGFGRCLAGTKSPQRLAETVLTEYGRTNDDALVVVARFRGAEE